jgi:hypothetical protein
MQSVAELIHARGHEVVSSWVTNAEGDDSELMYHQRLEWAQRDLDDIKRATFVLLFSDYPHRVRGGKHFECGYAHALGIQIGHVGPEEHIFGTLFDWVFTDVGGFLAWLPKRN